jgi:hypothetical protein
MGARKAQWPKPGQGRRRSPARAPANNAAVHAQGCKVTAATDTVSVSVSLSVRCARPGTVPWPCLILYDTHLGLLDTLQYIT